MQTARTSCEARAVSFERALFLFASGGQRAIARCDRHPRFAAPVRKVRFAHQRLGQCSKTRITAAVLHSRFGGTVDKHTNPGVANIPLYLHKKTSPPRYRDRDAMNQMKSLREGWGFGGREGAFQSPLPSPDYPQYSYKSVCELATPLRSSTWKISDRIMPTTVARAMPLSCTEPTCTGTPLMPVMNTMAVRVRLAGLE